MAPSPRLAETFPPPSAAWLLCAACGPLREEQAWRAGVSLAREAGLREKARLYEVEQALPFPALRRLVAGDAALREAMELVEGLRQAGSGRERPPTHAERAGRARAALLLGKGRDFMRHYGHYVQERPCEWHPDPEHMLFWDSVLGPGWEGADAVPEGAARQEILLLSASACAFFAPPAECVRGEGIGGSPAGKPWLEVAAALRADDREALRGMQEAGELAAMAAAELLAGRFERAQAEFEWLLGRSETNRYMHVSQHGLPLLVYALVGGVLSGASRRYLSVWLESARYALHYIFPPSMARRQAELMCFLDNLEQVDNVVNRQGLMEHEPCLNGSLSCLPYAMAFSALPAPVRRCLGAEPMARAVVELSRSGLRLLARYGAAGLRKEVELSLSGHLKETLAALLREGQEAALPPLPAPAPERAFMALVESVQKAARRGSALQQGLGASPMVLAAVRTGDGVVISLDREKIPRGAGSSPVLRCMDKFAGNGLLVLEGASPAEYTRLFAAMEAQVDVVGSLALPGEPVQAAQPRPVLLLAHGGKGCFYAALRVQLLPGLGPFMSPGAGMEVPVLEREDGSSVALRRDMPAEWRLLEESVRTLQQRGLVFAEKLLGGIVSFSGFDALAGLLRACREAGLDVCWEKGYALQLHMPRAGLSLSVGKGGGEWLELGGGLPVDEGRVLELSALLEAFAGREGGTMNLGDGEYLLLTPALERQLALLELVWKEKRGRHGVAAAAIPLLQALEAGDEPARAAAAPAPLPAGLRATLRPYQEEGFRWLAERVDRGMGALLADDMGLGKTVQVLALLLHAAAREGAEPALVIAPVSLLGNWAEEAARFAPSLNIILCDPRKPEVLAGLGAGDVLLASYGQLAARQKDFAARHWGLLVLDEAQAVKNPDSQRARAVCALRARARLCLTGTPIENSLLDLWSQMRFLNPGLLGTQAAFQRRFRKATEAQLALLRQVLAPLVLRRTKAEVLTQLPPLTEMVEWVEFSQEERALYESLRREAVKKLGQGSTEAAAGMGLLAELTRLRRACCHGRLALAAFAGDSAKLAALTERVEELRAAGRRALVFSQFTDVLDLAQEALQGVGINCLRLDGSTPAKKRTELVSDFQKGRADAFLISLKAGGAGLNLTAADYVILLDPWWNPAVEAQAAGRSHRMGQTQPVTLCRIMVRDTVEERIADMQRDKKELAEQVLSGKTEGMSLAHLRELLA